VDYAAGHQAGQSVNVTMQTVGSYGVTGAHSTWVSYMTRTPQGQWVHTTLWQVPAHTRINVTIYNYDSGSPLRNQQVGLVTGTAQKRRDDAQRQDGQRLDQLQRR
jgi:hypothetical protein